MDKKCVICGAIFKSPPSSKKVTCSPECRSKRAALSAKKPGRKWSKEAKEKRAADKSIIDRMEALQSVGTAAALSIPEGQRGPQNRESKVWELIDPEGNHIIVKNLLDWARENYTLFESPCSDVDAAAKRIQCGFEAIAGSMRGVKSRKRRATSYKGWGLYKLPNDPEEVKSEKNDDQRGG